MKQIHIDIDAMSNIAHTGVRRASLFMGLGLNAASREDFNDYELSKLPVQIGQTGFPLELFPRDLPAKRVKVFKDEFALWITACGLREILEHYALFLDEMHRAGLVVLAMKGELGKLKPQSAEDDFRERGIPRKLELLSERFGIAPDDTDCINSLYKARNCLTHDLGIVLPKRLNKKGVMEVSWRTLDIVLQGTASGTPYSLSEFLSGKPTVEETQVLARSVKKQREFEAQTKLVLTQEDLSGICFFFFAHAIPSALQSLGRFLELSGIEIRDTALDRARARLIAALRARGEAE